MNLSHAIWEHSDHTIKNTYQTLGEMSFMTILHHSSHLRHFFKCESDLTRWLFSTSQIAKKHTHNYLGINQNVPIISNCIHRHHAIFLKSIKRLYPHLFVRYVCYTISICIKVSTFFILLPFLDEYCVLRFRKEDCEIWFQWVKSRLP
jgi:hypothetical protein